MYQIDYSASLILLMMQNSFCPDLVWYYIIDTYMIRTRQLQSCSESDILNGGNGLRFIPLHRSALIEGHC